MAGANPTSTPTVRRVAVATVRWHLAAAALSASMLAMAFPRIGAGWLAHLALVPIALLALRSNRPARLAWTSYIVALAWWLVMIGWLAQVTVGGYAALCAFLALYTPAFVLTFRLLVRRWRFAAVIALPLAWVSFEFIRGLTPAGGFGWFALGHSQAPFWPEHGVSRLIQIADLFGEHGVSFLVAMTNGLIVDLLTRPLVKPGQRGRRKRRRIPAPLLVWLLVFGGAWIYGQWRISSSPNAMTGESLVVAVVQTNVPQDIKDNPTSEQMAASWRSMVMLAAGAAQREPPKPDLIVCPETMVPAALNAEALAYYKNAPTNERGLQQHERNLRDLARKLETHLLIGAHAKYDWREVPDPESDKVFMIPRRRFNSAFLFEPNSEKPLRRYDKIHRVPFGEYIPWVESWPWLKRQFVRYMTPYSVDYTLSAGVDWTVFELPSAEGTSSVRLASPICFEDAVPRVVRRMVYDGRGVKRADMLVNLTNDGWYAGTAQGPQHMQIAVLRCVENRVPMARSVNTGVSGFIDSVGRVLDVVSHNGQAQEVQGHAARSLTVDKRSTFFGRFSSMPILVLTGITGLLVFVGILRKVR